MLLLVRISDGFEEDFKARNTADILGRRAALTIDVARIIYGGIRRGGRLDRDRCGATHSAVQCPDRARIFLPLNMRGDGNRGR